MVRSKIVRVLLAGLISIGLCMAGSAPASAAKAVSRSASCSIPIKSPFGVTHFTVKLAKTWTATGNRINSIGSTTISHTSGAFSYTFRSVSAAKDTYGTASGDSRGTHTTYRRALLVDGVGNLTEVWIQLKVWAGGYSQCTGGMV